MADTAAADPRLTEMALRKGEVEIQKLSAEARSAELSSLTPSLPTDFPSGKLDAGDNASPLGVVAAYRSLWPVAANIANAIPQDATRVWIVPTDVVTRHHAVHEAVMSSLSRATNELATARSLLAPADNSRRGFVGVLALAASFSASALPSLASLMRTETTIRSRDVTMTFTAVAAAVANELLARTALIVTVDGVPAPSSPDLTAKVRALETERDELAKTLVAYRADGIDEPPPTLAAAAERLSVLKLLAAEVVKGKSASEVEPVIVLVEKAATAASNERASVAERAGRAAFVNKVLENVTAVLNGLTSADPKGVTPLQVASTYAENVTAHVLLLEPSYAGAESTYESVPARKDRGIHFGAVVVTYLLTDNEANLVGAGTVEGHALANTVVGGNSVDWGD